MLKPKPSHTLTPHSEVNLQLCDGQHVFAAAEVNALVVFGDVVNGQLQGGAVLRQNVLLSGDDFHLLKPFSPGGVCRRVGGGLRAD